MIDQEAEYTMTTVFSTPPKNGVLGEFDRSARLTAWRNWHAACQALHTAWIEADTTPSPAADAAVVEADRAEEAARAAVLARRELSPAAIGARLHIVFTLADVVDDPAHEPLRDLVRLVRPAVPAELGDALAEAAGLGEG